MVENNQPRTIVKAQAYVPLLSFSQRLRIWSKEENIHTTRSGVQSPKIHGKRPNKNNHHGFNDEEASKKICTNKRRSEGKYILPRPQAWPKLTYLLFLFLKGSRRSSKKKKNLKFFWMFSRSSTSISRLLT